MAKLADACGGALRSRHPQEALRHPQAGLAFLHSAKGPSDPPAKALGDSRVSTHRVRGRDDHVVRGPGHTASAAGAVVYLHGGAYTNEVVDQQWAFVAARRTGVEVHVPIYGLAPHTTRRPRRSTSSPRSCTVSSPRGVRWCCSATPRAVGSPWSPPAAPAVRQRVAGLLLIAPWIDLTMARPAVPDAVEPTDPWLTRAGLHPIARSWAGDLALTTPS